jgi:hypothetical protein
MREAQQAASKLPLGELEAPPGAGLAVFLPFHHPGITGQVTVTPQARIVGLIHLAKRPGKAVTAGAGLAVGTPAKDIDQHIKLIFVGGYHQGLTNHQGMFTLGKILGQILAVDGYFTAPVPNIHPGDGSLSSARTDTKIFKHSTTSL